MNVVEFMNEHKKDNKPFYLIPNILLNQKFDEPYWKYGFEISIIGNLPKEISNRKVLKSWKDDNNIVVIWENYHFDGKKYVDLSKHM